MKFLGKFETGPSAMHTIPHREPHIRLLCAFSALHIDRVLSCQFHCSQSIDRSLPVDDRSICSSAQRDALSLLTLSHMLVLTVYSPSRDFEALLTMGAVTTISRRSLQVTGRSMISLPERHCLDCSTLHKKGLECAQNTMIQTKANGIHRDI